MTTIIEQLFDKDVVLEESMLLDPRLQVFSILADNPETGYTIGELTKLVKVDRRKLQVMMNILFQYKLIDHDYNTRTYKYKDGKDAQHLKNQISMLRAL